MIAFHVAALASLRVERLSRRSTSCSGCCRSSRWCRRSCGCAHLGRTRGHVQRTRAAESAAGARRALRRRRGRPRRPGRCDPPDRPRRRTSTRSSTGGGRASSARNGRPRRRAERRRRGPGRRSPTTCAAAWPPSAAGGCASATTCTSASASSPPPAARRARPAALRDASTPTRGGISTAAGRGRAHPVIALHGLGGTKASFLPTRRRAGRPATASIAIDLPGFGDSDKPLGAPYDAAFFAAASIALLDALGDRARAPGRQQHGRPRRARGRAARTRPRRPARAARAVAGLAARAPWAPLLRLVPPASSGCSSRRRGRSSSRSCAASSRAASDGWTAAGVDEFLRAYLTPRGPRRLLRGRAQDLPRGARRRRRLLDPAADAGARCAVRLGAQDRLVPIAFARHVERAAARRASHLELDCGHVPQLERPRETHRALVEFLGEA